jgi:hypothetical protein
MPRISPLTTLGTLALTGGGALLAAYLLGKFPAYCSYRRAFLSFAGLCGFAAGATLLNLAFPLLYQPPYTTLLNAAWLTLSEALSAYLLWGARGLKETAGLLVLFGTTGVLLIGNAWPLIPAPPPLIELAAAWAATGTMYVLPSRFLWRRYLSRCLVARRPSTFTLQRALSIMAGYATCTALLFVALFWQGRHPVSLRSAFVWAGAYYAGITLLGLGSVTLYTQYRRGRFQRWLSREQQQPG